jgi:hypothetical protein
MNIFESLLTVFPVALASVMTFSIFVLLIDIFSMIFTKK